MPDVTLARQTVVEINTGSESTPDWVPIEGIEAITHSPATVRADARTYDSGGRHRHLVASRGDGFTFTGKYMVDESDGSRPPGQEAVEAAGVAMGQAARRQWRITDPSGENDITFFGSAELNRPVGGNDDLASWGFGLEVDGDIT